MSIKQICADFLERLDEEPELMEDIITWDETWIFQYDFGTEWQSCSGKLLHCHEWKKKGCRNKNIKTCWFSVARCADFEKIPHTVRKFVQILIFVRIFNKKSQFLVISAQIFISKEIFISALNTWTDLNSYILHVLMSYCRRSDYVTSEMFDHGVHGLPIMIRNTWS